MEPFKNYLNPKVLAQIATAIERSHGKFNRAGFIRGAEAEFRELELKERVRAISERLRLHLPEDTRKAIPILVQAVKQNDDDTTGIDGFAAWPLTDYVARFGREHFDLSMESLRRMTHAFSSEFAVRPFIIGDEARAIRLIARWAEDPSEHVRRLASEGTRPLLPWGERLPGFVADPGKTWNLLHALRNDPSEYVRRSVSNHVNDHSKNHADFVLKKLAPWAREKFPHTPRLIQHALRSLIKRGDARALKLIGIESGGFSITRFELLKKSVKLGQAMEALVVLKNERPTPLTIVIDYEFDLLGSRGQRRKKVFKGRRVTLAPRSSETLELRQVLKAVTTRTYYAGDQFWALIVNGERTKPLKFRLQLRD